MENDFILINALKFNQVASTTYYFQVLKTKLDTNWKKNEIKIFAIQKMKNKKNKSINRGRLLEAELTNL